MACLISKLCDRWHIGAAKEPMWNYWGRGDGRCCHSKDMLYVLDFGIYNCKWFQTQNFPSYQLGINTSKFTTSLCVLIAVCKQVKNNSYELSWCTTKERKKSWENNVNLMTRIVLTIPSSCCCIVRPFLDANFKGRRSRICHIAAIP